MKRFLILLLLSLFIFAPFAKAVEIKSKEAIYTEARKFFEEQGILQSETANRDTQRITRAEFFKMLLESVGYKADPKIRFIPTLYKDVSPTSWYAPYVQKAYRLGVLTKTDFFNPAQNIRTIDALESILSVEGYTIPKIYDQEQISKYHDLQSEREKQIASKILELSVYIPKSELTFGAQIPLKRSEVIVLLYQFHLITDADKSIYGQSTQNPITIELTPSSNLPNIEYLESVHDQILSKYYKAPEVNEQKLMDSAIEGYVKGVGDKYTVYFPPQDSKDFNDSLQGAFEGIGAYLENTDKGIVIVTPIKGSPAEKAGVKAGDIIKKVDGKDVKGLKAEDAVALIKGPKGTPVTIEFERSGQAITLIITRDHIEIPSVTGELKDEILIISMHQFGANSLREFSDIISQYSNTSYKGIVLDLRSNPGGFLTSAEAILSYWIQEDQPIVQLKYRDHNEKLTASKNQKLSNVKTAVLINKSSASASEIVSGTMQDYKKAQLFGETSFGKGSVQELVQYRNGGMLKVTVAEWLTGKGNSINGKGVNPDLKVADDEKTKNDEVMDAAMLWLKQ